MDAEEGRGIGGLGDGIKSNVWAAQCPVSGGISEARSILGVQQGLGAYSPSLGTMTCPAS